MMDTPFMIPYKILNKVYNTSELKEDYEGYPHV